MSLEAQKSKTSSQQEYDRLGSELAAKKDQLTQAEAALISVKKQHQEQGLKDKSVDYKEAEKKVKDLKAEVNQLTREWRKADPNKLNIDRTKFEEHLTRRFFVIPSFEIYGGTAGLFDLGPVACAVKANVLNLWRRHFVLEENMLELDLPCITPEPVFIASGHVARFNDFMVRDTVTNEAYRADKLLAEFIEKELENPATTSARAGELRDVLKEIDGYSSKQLSDAFKRLGVTAPETGNPLSEPFPFNLMFSTQIGPTGKLTGYMRPETAQGIFVNFKRLLDFNNNQMPFAGATIGQAFRNEIAPRSGLLRVREFTLAEIEHFMNPETSKDEHPKFHTVKDVQVPFLSRELQSSGKPAEFVTVGDAIQRGILKNGTLAYFIGRTFLFMTACGILREGIRFRQHMGNEMAHYASDCWDCELLTSYGWIECVGLADRSCYDLTAHSDKTKADLTAYEEFKVPKIEKFIQHTLDKKVGASLKNLVKPLTAYLDALNDEAKLHLKSELEKNGKIAITLTSGDKVELTPDMISFKEATRKIAGQSYLPSVVEPSFGIGRIIYCILEHAFWIRKEEEKEEKKGAAGDKKIERVVLSFPPQIAPYKVVVLPQQQNEGFYGLCRELSTKLTFANVSNKTDFSGQTIGKKYARFDDLGVSFAVTVDFKSLEDKTVTIRERDSCTQIRLPLDDAVKIIDDLIAGRLSWDQARKIYPEQQETASAKVGKGAATTTTTA